MQTRHSIKSLVMTALASGLCLPGSASTSAASPLTSASEGLAIGQALRYDQGLKLTFVSVENDSRCPMGALCITQGDAEVVLLAYVGNKPAKVIKIHTYNDPRKALLSTLSPCMVGIPKTYTVKIGTLSPWQRIGGRIKQSEYRLVLDIKTAL